MSEHSAVYFNICPAFDNWCQLRSHDLAANLSTLTTVQLL